MGDSDTSGAVAAANPTAAATGVAPVAAQSPELAGLWRRFASLAYEAILLLPLLFIGGWIFTLATRWLSPVWIRPGLQVWLLALTGGYFVYCWRSAGQTLAMRTWHVRVARPDGSALSTSTAIARYLLALWSVLLVGVGFLWALVDREHQFLHDRLTGARLIIASSSGGARSALRETVSAAPGGESSPTPTP